jgi:PEGA domain
MIVRSAVLALALVMFPATASAQLEAADRATARALAQQGQDALDLRDFTTAADRFGRAAALVHVPTLALGLARAQVGLGQWIAAQDTYHRLLDEGAGAGRSAVFLRALADARRELDALEPRLPGVIITVKGAPNARVTVDGAPVPSAELGVSRIVDPGRHVVRAEAEGFTPAEATVTVAERKTQPVTLTLVPGAADPPPSAKPPAPLAPQVAPPEPPASHGSMQKAFGFAALGVGGAGLLVGAITSGIEIARHSALVTACPGSRCLPAEYAALDSYHGLSNVAPAGLIAGGVLATVGIVLVATAPGESAARQAWMAPVIGARFAGAQGRF